MESLSVILPVFNSEAFLVPTLESLKCQSYQPLEIIVIDGGSIDGTLDILERYRSVLNLTLISQASKGLYQAWNEGIESASGEWIYVVGSDDIVYPFLFEKLYSFICSNPPVDICSWLIDVIDSNGKIIHQAPIPVLKEVLGKELSNAHIRSGLFDALTCCYISSPFQSHVALAFRKSISTRIGGFPVQFGSAGDIAWTIKACLESDIAYLPFTGAAWRLHNLSATGQCEIRSRINEYINLSQVMAPFIFERLKHCVDEEVLIDITKSCENIFKKRNFFLLLTELLKSGSNRESIKYVQEFWDFRQILFLVKIILLKVFSNFSVYRILVQDLRAAIRALPPISIKYSAPISKTFYLD